MNKLLFVLIHLGCLLVFWCGASVTAISICLLVYTVRMFAITAGYHRLFSHRSYKTSRIFQFLIAFIGASSAQKGPLWWAACHRHHHKHSDTELDLHSPGIKGFWWAHAGWVLSDKYDRVDLTPVKDIAAYPELRLLDRYHYIPPLMLLFSAYPIGMLMNLWFPFLNITPFQMVIWGALISTVMLYHGTFVINSLAHIIGKRRFDTDDQSRNSFILAIITLGEGWHNNHHRCPSSERQGFYWWEIDVSHYILVFLSKLGLVWDLKTPPTRILNEASALTISAQH